MSFSLVIAPDSFTRARSGNVVGVVYVLIDGEAFPDAQWSDFPCLVLGDWWRVLHSSGDPTLSLRFMDGPALIECERRHFGQRVELILRPTFDTEPPTFTRESQVAEAVVVAEVRRAARIVIAACREKGLPDQGLSRALGQVDQSDGT